MDKQIKTRLLIRVVVIVGFAVIALIAALQNTASVETHLLFLTVTMPRALLLLTMLAVGFAIGLATAFVLSRRKAPGPRRGSGDH